MTEEEKKQEGKRIVEALKTMPEAFMVDGFEKKTVIAEIESESEIGELFTALIGNSSPDKPISLGKRYQCLNCKSAVLATKVPTTDIGS
ncbi:MAG: hypothetical protein Q7R84_03035, partial [bacterium]|nr:hypothetical protein [bacterium]